MKEIRVFVAISLAQLAVVLLLFFTGNLPAVLSIGWSLASMGILLGWVAYRINRSWHSMTPEEKQRFPVLGQMRWVFITVTVFYLIDLIPHVLLVIYYPDERTVTTAHWFAHVFLFVFAVLASRMALSFFHPRLKNLATGIVSALAVVALLMSAYRPDHLIFVPDSKYALLSSDYAYAMFNMVINVIAFGLSGLFLIIRGTQARERIARVRSILIGVGFLCSMMVGYVVHFVHNLYVPVILSFLFTLLALSMGIGGLYMLEKPEIK